MHLKSPKGESLDSQARYWGRSDGTFDRVLLVLGAISLLALVPILWIWLLYGSGFGSQVVYAGAIGLSGLTAGLGFAMIRILDGRQ
jgi:hypothetical protein